MRYRTLGKTGVRLSELGFGAMRLPMKKIGDAEVVDRDLAVPMIRRAFEGGVNYIDSATFYCNEDSQRAVGDALKGWRDRVYVATKNPYYDEDEGVWRQNLENSLERLQIDYIDFYHTHAVSAETYFANVEPRISKWLQKAKDEGLIRRIAASFHDNNNALRRILDAGYYESILLQYNLLDRSLEDGIAHARDKGVGVIVMGPVGGGRLGGDDGAEMLAALPSVKRLPELALRFVLANPGVTTALSGMSTMGQVEENLRIAGESPPLSPADRAAIGELAEKFRRASDLYCSACDYCKPCPSGINIPRLFGIYNKDRVYGLHGWAERAYRGITENQAGENAEKPASACAECGVCEPKCPQKHPIRERLKEIRARFERGLP